MTGEEADALFEAGIVSGDLAFIDGVAMMGPYPLAFSPDQLKAAAAPGMGLRAPAVGANDKGEPAG